MIEGGKGEKDKNRLTDDIEVLKLVNWVPKVMGIRSTNNLMGDIR